ncbi:MAG: hypothetical protein J7577_21555 [Sphingobacteriaceae bacterium]|nr:hypothetical protein [Sphingobacteriaceae bacterium]
MKSKRAEALIPEQEKGSQLDVVEERVAPDEITAKKCFDLACDRLLRVSRWGEISGMSAFILFDKNGRKVTRKAETGDYIRIDIPGPGPSSGAGYDWVKIEEIVSKNEADEQFLAIRVRPAEFPLSNDGAVAHFLQDVATSTFLIRRKGTTVTAEEHGRNELPNISEGNLPDRVRNLIVGLAAKLGLSYPQWKMLVKGFLDGCSA